MWRVWGKKVTIMVTLSFLLFPWADSLFGSPFLSLPNTYLTLTFSSYERGGIGHPLGNFSYEQEYSHVKANAQVVLVGEGEDGESEGEMV